MSNNKRKLDNSAKIFPMMSSKKYSSVFRISTCLTEKIDEKLLQSATEKALDTFSSFKVKLKQGFFWHYYEENKKTPIVQNEPLYPCKYIDPKENNDYLFKVSCKENKVNIDIFHSLTDGNSGVHFFKEIIYNYLDLKYKDQFNMNLRADRKVEYTTEDDYIKYYDKKSHSNTNVRRAYLIQGKKMKNPKVNVIYEKIDLKQLKETAKSNGATITQFLTAVLLNAIYKANYLKYNGKRPIKICVPVDLKKYFKSETVNNFFSYITVEGELKNNGSSEFYEILELVKKQFKQKLTEDEIKKTMSGNVRLGKNKFISVIPLFLKKIIVKLSYIEIRKYTTITFSNIGRIGVIGKYNDFINEFMLLIAPEQVEKVKCSSCSYGDKLIFTFTSILKEMDIEKEFHNILREQNIDCIMDIDNIEKNNNRI